METINNLNVSKLKLKIMTRNFSMENLHNHIIFILDEFAPFKKLSRGEMRLKSKPWISQEILHLMWQRD